VTPALHQLDISYRDGGLALDDRSAPGQLRAGDRAPDGITDDGTRLFDLFRGPQFTLLGFGQVPSNPACNMPVTTLSTCTGYDIDNGTFVLGGWCEAAYAGALCVGRRGLVGSGVGRSWVVRGPTEVVPIGEVGLVALGWALLFLLSALFVLVSGLPSILWRGSAG
jgi:hypothetical protein